MYYYYYYRKKTKKAESSDDEEDMKTKKARKSAHPKAPAIEVPSALLGMGSGDFLICIPVHNDTT